MSLEEFLIFPSSLRQEFASIRKIRLDVGLNFYQTNDATYNARNNASYPAGYTITNDVHHLLPNIESTEMFSIDPGVGGGGTTLEDVADGLIDLLLTAGDPVPGTVLGAGAVQQLGVAPYAMAAVRPPAPGAVAPVARGLAAAPIPLALVGGLAFSAMPGVNPPNRFTITATYNPTGALAIGGDNITQDVNIGYVRNGLPTQKVTIVVQVIGGVISIVTMFPSD
ncbi:MAG: hypothetical protein LBD36_03030 [Holosporales bacterium]|nr:hypothetical protein [Holosporales bacterium]